MRNLLLLVPLLFSTLPQHALAATITGDECNARVEEMRSTLPMQLDGVTTWVNTTCVNQGNNTLQLVYENEVTDGNDITQANLDTVLESLIMSWCFGPDLSPLIAAVDSIKYVYSFENGTASGELNFSEEDCDMARRP